MISTVLVLGSQALSINPSWELAFERGGNLYVSRANGQGLRMLAKSGAWPRWSPDGKQVAFYRSGALYTVDVRTGSERRVVAVPKVSENGSFGIDWDPLRPAIVCGPDDADGLTLVDLTKRSQSKILGRWRGWFTYGARWSPSGEYLAFLRNGDVWIASRESGSRSGAIDPGAYYEDATRLHSLAVFNDVERGASIATPFWVDELEWTRDEKKLVFHFQRQGGSGVSEIGYLELRPNTAKGWSGTAPFQCTVKWLLSDVFSPRICPDGKTLSYTSSGDLYACSWDGKQKRLILKDVGNPAWRLSGRHR